MFRSNIGVGQLANRVLSCDAALKAALKRRAEEDAQGEIERKLSSKP